MTPEQWQRAKELLEEALDRAVDERTAFLDEACSEDREVRAAVEDMLKSGQPPSDFLQPPAAGAAVDLLVEGVLPAALGAQIGAYRLDDVISSGGMGTVYRAARVDQELEQQVAVKIIRRGMASPDVLRRFRREAQTLARLEHPHVARFLDAGTTDDGLPYLVMEYVPGQALDRFCDERRLKVRERLALFRKVCAAVHYAHQNLIVHRDLKPGNVLVTDDGLPKLLDFGIAKLLDPEELAEFGDPTTTAHRVMTPQYASPEQIRGEPTTTASDVYSLGVMLYELVTGHRPYEVKAKPRNELERLICEVEPATPSAAISRIIEIAQPDGTTRRITPDTVADQRDDRPDRLRRRLAGDIDTIIMTALHKDPSRRYASVEQLSEDLRRHLEGLPVQARPDTWSYRTAKFIRRNKVTVSAGVLVLLSLTGGIIGTAIGLRRAEEARAEALAEAENALVAMQTAERINDFLQVMLAAADPYKEGKDVTVRQVLDLAAGRIADELADEPLVRAAVQHTIGATYASLALYDAAEPHLQAALQIRRDELGTQHAEIWPTLYELGQCRLGQGDYDSADQRLREALTICSAHFGEDHPDVARLQAKMAFVAYQRGHYDESRDLYEKALELTRRSHGEDHPYVASCLSQLASVHRATGSLHNAEQLCREALSMRRKHLGPRHLDVALDLSLLGGLLRTKGDLAAAETMYREALEIRRKHLDDRDPRVAEAIDNLGVLLRQRGDLTTAEVLYREALDIRIASLGREHPAVADNLNNLALVLHKKGDYESSESLFREALRIGRATYGDAHPHVANCTNNFAVLLKDLGRYDEAENMYRRALAAWRAAVGEEHLQVATCLHNLGRLLYRKGDVASAKGMLYQAVEIRKRKLSESHVAVGYALSALGTVLLGEGEFKEAKAVWSECLSIVRQNRPEGHLDIAAVQADLARALFGLGDYSAAAAEMRPAVDVTLRELGQNHPSTVNRQYVLGKALMEMGILEEAEELLRTSVQMRRQHVAKDDWVLAVSEGMLGRCLMLLERYATAEPLVITGYPIIASALGEDDKRTHAALQRIIDLYEAWSQPEEAAKWRAKLPVDEEANTRDPGRADAATGQPATSQAAADTPDRSPVTLRAPGPGSTATSRQTTAQDRPN